MLSLAAVVAITLSVWACVRRLGGSSVAAILAALWWLASLSRWYDRYVGMDDPQLVAQAVMTCSLAYALRDPKSARINLAIPLMAIAGFYKHNLLATPAATLCWWASQDWRRGLRLGLLGIGAVALGLAICAMIFGGVFFHGLLLPRHYDIARLSRVAQLQFIAPGLIIAAIWAAHRRHEPRAQFVSIFLTFGLFSYLGQSLWGSAQCGV
jgi:uncharacterized membrane protein